MIERPRWAWEELKPGDVIQPGDEWQNDDGRWHPLILTSGACTQVRDGLRARRPHNITALLVERDEARAEVAKLQAEQQELTERLHGAIGTKAAAASESAKAKDDLKSAQRARDELQRQVDELRADRDKLQGLIDDLLDEPTARQVQEMLRKWATELDWSVGCFGSFGRSQIDIIQQTMVAVMERIEHMINPEGTSADA